MHIALLTLSKTGNDMTLSYNTVTPLLREVLMRLMEAPQLKEFRLVGGTSLSLRLGHRESIDIDLFTDRPYHSIDFKSIYEFLRTNFKYAATLMQEDGLHSFGESFYLGESEFDTVKVDLFYTDPFIHPVETIDRIRFASTDDIVAMKVDVISRTGRKKDFWDLHELFEHYSFDQMLELHQRRFPALHDREELIGKFTDFSVADDDFDPNCLQGKYWELIKMDFVDWIQQWQKTRGSGL